MASEAAIQANPDFRRAIGVVGGCFVVALAALLAGYLILTIPDSWFSRAEPKVYDAKVLAVAVGTGSIDGDVLVVRPTDASGTIIITIAVSVPAGDYRGVAWQVSGLPAATEARLLWRSEFKPGRTFSLPLPMEADRLAPVVASRDPNWMGPINGIALALRLPSVETVRISGLALARWRPHWIGAGLPAALIFMFVAAWLVLDARWQWNLARQVIVTANTYAGRDWREKHVAAEDGPLFEFIEKARAKMSAVPARVFMVAEAHYFRGRGAYHLYPHNVFFDPWTNAIPPTTAMRPGDYIVVYHRRGIQFDAAQGTLRWDGGPPLAAEPLVVEPGAALFRVR